jgi:hypothetical protein
MSLSLLMADKLRAYAEDHAATLPVELAGLLLDSADQHVATQADLDRACRTLERLRRRLSAPPEPDCSGPVREGEGK